MHVHSFKKILPVRYYGERGDAVAKASKNSHVVSSRPHVLPLSHHALKKEHQVNNSVQFCTSDVTFSLDAPAGRLQTAGARARPVSVLGASPGGPGHPQHLRKDSQSAADMEWGKWGGAFYAGVFFFLLI